MGLGIRFLDSCFDPESGLRFSADFDFHREEDIVTVRHRSGDLKDQFPLADVDPDVDSIEGVAERWLAEHRGGVRR